MGNQQWSGLMEELSDNADFEDADRAVLTAADLVGLGGCPEFFCLTESLGFCATGTGEGLLCYLDRKKDMAFLFPQSRKMNGGPRC